MLNELHDLAQSLNEIEVAMASWHMHFKTCPKGTTTFFLLLDPLGQVAELEPVADRERLATIRKWEVAAGTSFPAFNVLPLYEPTGEEGKKSAVELRKAITSKSPPKSDEIKQRLESLVGESASLWVKKEPARITKCLTTLAGEVGCTLGAPPDDFLSISELIARSGKLTAETLQAQLASVLANKIIGAPNLAADWFDAFFFHSGKDPKKWSLIAELADRSAFAYPANHERVQVWMNSRFQAFVEPSAQTTSESLNEQADAFAKPATRLDDSFPSVRLPKLGEVKLRAMSSESPCQRRYGFADSRSFRVGQVSRQDMKNALEWIGHPDRHEKTWCDVSSLNGVSGVLFAYPSQKPEVAPELAGLIAGLDNKVDPDGAKFEACAARVTASLTELVRKQQHEAPATEVRVFVLTKPDGFRTKVLNSGRYSVERLLTSANEWKAFCRNVPSLFIRQFGAHAEVLAKLCSIAKKIVPGNIARMVVVDHHRPFFDGDRVPRSLARSPIAYDRPGLRSAMNENARVTGIFQHVDDGIVNRHTPDNLPTQSRWLDVRQRESFLAIPQKDLSSRTRFAKLGKYAAHRLLNLTIGIHLDARIVGADVTDRDFRENQTPANHLQERFASTLPHEPQLEFRHAPFEPEQETIVEQAGIVDAVLVDHQGVGHRAEIDKVMPVAVVARQTRGFESEHGSHRALADRREETAKSSTLHRTAARLAQVVVDHGNPLEAQLASPTRQRILTFLPFFGVADLLHARLPNVDDRGPFTMGRLNLLDVHRFSFRRFGDARLSAEVEREAFGSTPASSGETDLPDCFRRRTIGVADVLSDA